MSRIRNLRLGLLAWGILPGLVSGATGQTPAPAPAVEPADLTAIPAEATLAVVCYPKRALTQPEHAQDSALIVAEFPLTRLGVDLTKIERMLVVMLPPKITGPTFGALVRFDQPVAKDELLENFGFSKTIRSIDGRDFYPNDDSQSPEFLLGFVNERTLLFGHYSAVIQMARREPADSALLRLIRGSAIGHDIKLYFVVAPVRGFLQGKLRALDSNPIATALRDVPRNLETIEAGIPIWGPGRATVNLQAVDEGGAKQIEAAALAVVTYFRSFLVEALSKPPPAELQKVLEIESIRKGFDQTIEKARTELFAEYLPKRDRDCLTIALDVKVGAADLLLKTAQKKAAEKDPLRK
jgi:hypothetical protein